MFEHRRDVVSYILTMSVLRRYIHTLVINEGTEDALALVDRFAVMSLEDIMRSFVGKTYKQIQDKVTFLSLYSGNKYGIGGFPPENEQAALDFVKTIEWFFNAKHFEKFKKILDQRDDPDLKERYGYDVYKELDDQVRAATRKYFQSDRSAEARKAMDDEKYDITQQIKQTEWHRFLQSVESQHKKAVAARDHTPITEQDVELDGSDACQKLIDAYNEFMSYY